MKIRNIFRTFMNEGPKGVVRKINRKLSITAKISSSRLFPERPVKSKYGVLLAPNWDDLTFRLCAFADYGPYLARYLADYPLPFAFLDIGANQGLYSLLAAKNPHCQRVHSFEPVKKTFDLLTKNIALNGLAETIAPHPFGISNIDAQVPIYVKEGHSGVASIRGQEGSHISGTIEIKSAASIAPLLPANLPIVIKIDVEGHEEEVIASIAEAGFAARVQAIFYEVDESWVSPRALENILRNIGFSSFEKVGEGTHYDVMAQRQ
ncbi:hypothetical protein AEAC466_20000 [Asticcacaulis sp. AC466]|uniref:FkbM family methyltransferase n=1 Tax=Asticcacaulis sp. AC466 TaxID=1282362 RepID=UPI0003C3C508|nr:FkbM family methyltransferase [Asticcacaulis sp. AC466]ESQ81848.1 hypothetical protein AEAC466_20000 [Asticcacaulis sp. AC466]